MLMVNFKLVVVVGFRSNSLLFGTDLKRPQSGHYSDCLFVYAGERAIAFNFTSKHRQTNQIELNCPLYDNLIYAN